MNEFEKQFELPLIAVKAHLDQAARAYAELVKRGETIPELIETIFGGNPTPDEAGRRLIAHMREQGVLLPDGFVEYAFPKFRVN